VTVAEHRRRRLEFVKRLYEETGGRTLTVVSVDELAAELGWSDAEASAVVEYLDAEGLIEHQMGNQASITHAGVVEVEEALENPTRATEHFPAVNVVLVQGSVVGSQIQAGATGSEQYQEVRLLQDREGITQFLTELRNVLAAATVEEEDRAAANADIASVEAQLTSPRPNEAVVREGLRSLRSVAENLVASGAFMGLLELAQRLPL
jgi:DNA-binding transcriptional MocR family regulator